MPYTIYRDNDNSLTKISKEIKNEKFEHLRELFTPQYGYEAKAFENDEFHYLKLGNYYQNKDFNDMIKMMQFKNITLFTDIMTKYLKDDEILFENMVQRFVKEDIALYSTELKSKIFGKIQDDIRDHYPQPNVDKLYEDFIYKTLLENGDAIRYNYIFKNFKYIYTTNPLLFKYEKPENLSEYNMYGRLHNSFITWSRFKLLPAYKATQELTYQYVNGRNQGADQRGYEILSRGIVKNILKNVVKDAQELVKLYDYTRVDKKGRLYMNLEFLPDVSPIHWTDNDGVVKDQHGKIVSTYPEVIKLI